MPRGQDSAADTGGLWHDVATAMTMADEAVVYDNSTNISGPHTAVPGMPLSALGAAATLPSPGPPPPPLQVTGPGAVRERADRAHRAGVRGDDDQDLRP